MVLLFAVRLGDADNDWNVCTVNGSGLKWAGQVITFDTNDQSPVNVELMAVNRSGLSGREFAPIILIPFITYSNPRTTSCGPQNKSVENAVVFLYCKIYLVHQGFKLTVFY